MTVETGTICLWYGSIATIPDGWLLCDGLNDTPNLKDRFVPGAGATYNPGDFGGTTAHRHNFTSNTHDHSIGPGPDMAGFGGYYDQTTLEVATGQTELQSHLPPYYALAYIMKS